MKFIILDLNGLAHRLYWKLPQMRIEGQECGMLFGLAKTILDLIRNERPEFLVAAIDAPGSKWRHEYLSTYKANRKPAPDELKQQLGEMKRLIELMGVATVQVNGYEADDIIAEFCSRKCYSGVSKVVVSSDKDLMQLVKDDVRQFDPATGIVYDDEAVKAKLGVYPKNVADYLALCGDSSDNVPGVKGIGKVAAIRIIEGQATERDKQLLLAGVESLAISQMVVALPGKPIESLPTLAAMVTGLRPKLELSMVLRDYGFGALATEAGTIEELCI